VTFSVPRPQRPQLPQITSRVRIIAATVVTVIVLIILWSVFAAQYTDLLWFRSVDYSSVYSRRLLTELLLFFVFGAVMAVVVAANIVIAYRLRPPYRPVSQEQRQLEHYRQLLHRYRGWALGAVALLIGIITGASASRRWQTWLLWRNGTSFHHTDPQFHKDVSYFAFTYPMQRFVLGTLFAMVAVSLIAVLVTAYLYGSLRIQTPGTKWTPAGRVHVSVLLGVFVLLKAIAYWLDRYGLAFSGRGIVTGPSYTDVHAVLPAKDILVFVAIICALLFFANVVTRNWMLPAIAFGLMVISAIVIGGVYPALVQHFKVAPSAQDLEAKYIARNIQQTRIAYGITPDQVSVNSGYPGVSSDPPKTLAADATTEAQLRVLDPNVVSATFNQLQQQRSFYSFPSTLDVDRYPISNKLTDVVLGVRDIDLTGLPSGQRSWINEHLVYTHGFGVVVAQANEADSKGSPSFVEQDLPPTGALDTLQPQHTFQPRIYFGETSPNYSIVGAGSNALPRELDRPADSASGQINNTYGGNGGVPLGSFFHKLLYAWKYKDKNILLSSGVNSHSRILYVRNPRARVAKVAPWLTLDGDPYPVVVDGKVLWVVDGYTTTSGFPYSEQESLGSSTRTSLTTRANTIAAQRNSKINYIRNSVKATVDAYTGQVNLYAWDQSTNRDPVLATWEKAFPGVVKPQSAMPQGLQNHFRYPEDLFNLQRTLLAHYHVTTPKTFYNGTGFWNVPYDPTLGDGTSTISQPAYYYTVSPNGGTQTPVFSLTSPLVSLNRNNLTAFLSVNSDPESSSYGHFTLLEVPTDQVTQGPRQVQNNIESTTTVSRELSLLRQGGSRVTLGNLLTVPLDGGFLYVEPIYVQSAGAGSFPELRRVATFYDGSVGYKPTLQAALDQVFGVKGAAPVNASGGQGSSPTPPTPPTTTPHSSAALRAAVADAQAAYAKAQADLKAGRFAAYGRDQKALQSALKRIAAASGSKR
jgi:uncharacterized membrane protein (UPF0182 family)